jgi:hypothetical protein
MILDTPLVSPGERPAGTQGQFNEGEFVKYGFAQRRWFRARRSRRACPFALEVIDRRRTRVGSAGPTTSTSTRWRWEEAGRGACPPPLMCCKRVPLRHLGIRKCR